MTDGMAWERREGETAIRFARFTRFTEYAHAVGCDTTVREESSVLVTASPSP
jgi:hypothetical protein